MLVKVGILVVALVSVASAAQAQAIVNPSQLTWIGPTMNTDGSPLTDLSGYRLRVAGPLAVGAPCPAFALATYPIKATHPSLVTTPLPGVVVTYGTPSSRALATDLGLTIDGGYCVVVSAVDLTLNEGAASGVIPFTRNLVAPGVPSGLQLNQ